MNGLTRVSTAMLVTPANTSEGAVLSVTGDEVLPLLPSETITGVTSESSFDPVTGRLQLVNVDKSVVIIDLSVALNGKQGKQGNKGNDGNRGIPGRNGRDGKQGIQGCPGDKGDDGPIGPTGPTGPTGKQGNLGPIGPTGPTGATGAPGEDGEEPEWIKGSNGVAIKLRRAGGMIASGRFELVEVNRHTISLLFPKPFINEIRSLTLTFLDPWCYQASNYTIGEYIMDDVEIGGVTITLKGSIPSPLADKWDFYWTAMGD